MYRMGWQVPAESSPHRYHHQFRPVLQRLHVCGGDTTVLQVAERRSKPDTGRDESTQFISKSLPSDFETISQHRTLGRE
jgi:hypothetical protein